MRIILLLTVSFLCFSLQWSEFVFGIIALRIAKIQGLSLQLCRIELSEIQSLQKFGCRLSTSTLLKNFVLREQDRAFMIIPPVKHVRSTLTYNEIKIEGNPG